MQAAQAGDCAVLQKLADEQPWLLAYRGKGTSFGFCGARAVTLQGEHYYCQRPSPLGQR